MYKPQKRDRHTDRQTNTQTDVLRSHSLPGCDEVKFNIFNALTNTCILKENDKHKKVLRDQSPYVYRAKLSHSV